MNLKTQSISKLESSSDFNKNILNPFLEESKDYYPNSIIESNNNCLNITLLKQFPKNRYSFEYEESIKLIFTFLKELVKEYELTDIRFYENLNYGFNPSFKIKVPNNISSKDITNYSDEIFKKVGKFAELNNIEFILDDLSIILCR